MATFEDAAEDLVIKLKGLEDEMEQSRHRLEEMKDHLQTVCDDVDEGWEEMTEKIAAFVATVGEEEESVVNEAQGGLEALGEAKGAVEGSGGEAHAELDGGRDQVLALSEHVADMESPLETLVVDGAEVPAEALAQRAAEIETELEQTLQEAREFLTDEVGTSLHELQEEIRDRCEELHTTLTVECAGHLQEAFDDWTAKVDEVEELIETQAFTAAPPHASETVTYGLTACSEAKEEQLSALRDLVAGLTGVLDELKDEVDEAATDVATEGADALAQGMEALRQSLGTAGTALDAVRDLLGSYGFVG